MNCYKHYDRTAVSQCIECSKALCPECTSKYNKPLCDQCVIEGVKRNKSMLVKNIVIMVAIFLIGFSNIFVENLLGERLLLSIMFSGFPWGWSFLNKITPQVFLFMPIVGWLIYFSIKFVLSVIIGIIVMPFKINQIIKGLKQSEEMLKYATE